MDCKLLIGNGATVESIEELNKTLKESGRVTERYTVVLMMFAMIQILLATVQIGMSMLPDELKPFKEWTLQDWYHLSSNLTFGIILIGGMILIFRFGNNIFTERNLWEKKKN